MSFNINSDKEFISGSRPQFIGTTQFSIRAGTGVDEKEVIRTLLDSEEKLPRVGINRTGQRVNNIAILTQGSGYTVEPTVTVSPPPAGDGAKQALASAFIFNGRIVNIAVNDPGKGYSVAPTVTITGGNGGGASAEAALDTVDYELDINGAIRTSTSIISDTARILNLDIDNFVTPDLNLRGPNLKNYLNNTGTIWVANTIVQKDVYRYFGANVYQSLNSGQTGPEAPEHLDGIVLNNEVNFKHIGFRVVDENAFGYNETGEAGVYPRSITPLLGDRSDKIATTEYVLNLATNDVGGRIYVSSQIGNDLNDGRSAVNPVRSIKKAAQLAWETPGVKETIIVSGGDYVEDNPISLPPDASVVGDNLRLVLVRPNNPGKHIFKFGDKNYVIGVTYRDKIDANGDAISTWDFAMVFDDKQRINVDSEVNGDFGVNFPIGHQVFGSDKFRIDFQNNTGLSQLVSGLEAVGVNTGARGNMSNVVFTTVTGNNAYQNGSLDVEITSGSFLEGEGFRYIIGGTQGASLTSSTGTVGTNQFAITSNPTPAGLVIGSYVYLDGTANSEVGTGFYEIIQIDDDNAPTQWEITVAPLLSAPGWRNTAAGNINIYAASITEGSFDSTKIKSIRAEGEVVFQDEDYTTPLPIVRMDFSLQGDPSIATGGFQNTQFGDAEDLGGVVFYTSALAGRQNFHDFKDGQEILIEGLSTSAPDLSFLNGRQRIYKVIEDADGRARRFVIPKKIPAGLGLNANNNFDPGQFAVVKSASRSVTLSLLNSPNKFPLAQPVDRRFQDAATFIRNNREFIADEVVGRINREFAQDYHSVYGIGGQSFSTYSASDATYNPATGEFVITMAGHGLSLGEGIRIADNSFVFTCAMDGNATEHSLPESGQYASGKSLPILESTVNTVTVNVGASGPNQYFTPSNASYDPTLGTLQLIIGAHALTPGEGVVIDNNSLSFKCAMDGYDSVKSYPRAGIDPFASRSIPIVSTTADSITLQVGISRENFSMTPTAATYDAATGDMTVDVGQHGLGVGRNVVLNDNSFTFTCDIDGNATQHTYPRPSDPASGKSLAITSVGTTSHTPTNVDYDATDGDLELTINSHGFSTGDYIKVDDGSLVFTCDLDGNVAQKAYPRAGFDLPSGRWLEITVIDSSTIRFNVGPSSYTGTHTWISAAADAIKRQDGTFTFNVGSAGAAVGSNHVWIASSSGAIKHEPRANHLFQGSTTNAIRHLPQSAHTFVRSTAGGITTGGSAFKIYLGATDHIHTYVSGGTVTFGGNDYSITSFVYDSTVTGVAEITTTASIPGLAEDDIVKLADLLISCDAGTKVYPSYSSPTSGNNINLSNGDEQCKQDLNHFMNAVIRDLEFGTNHNVIDSAKKFIVNERIAYIEDEIVQNVRAIEYARELIRYAVCNWRTVNRTPADPIYTPVYSGVTRYFDDTVITTTAGTPACANVISAIDVLSFLWTDVITNNASGTQLDAGYLIIRNADLIADQALLDTKSAYPSLNLSDVMERKCKRDIKIVLDGLAKDLVLGGNSGIVAVAESYFSGAALVAISEAQREETIYAYQRVQLHAIAAMRNWTGGNVIDVTPNTAQYNSSTGQLSLTITDPGLTITANDRIAFKEGALTFNCAYGGGGDHSNPKPGDANYGKSQPIISASSAGGVTTIVCNVGNAGLAAGLTHTLTSALTDGTIIIYDPVTTTSPIPQYEDWNILIDINGTASSLQITPESATYDPATGLFVVTSTGHSVSQGDQVQIASESVVFTCAMDGNKTEHALPSSGQNAYNNILTIDSVTSNTFTINVGVSGSDVQFTPSDASYNTTTGDLEINIGPHTLSVGEGIVIDDNSLTFTCDMDGNQSQKTYPRPGIDPFAGRSMPITSTSATTITVFAGISGPNKFFTPSAADYNPSTGDMTLTVGQHGLGVGRNVTLANSSLTFTCAADGNATNHSYPRAGTDPQADNKSVAITSVGTTTATPTDAAYNAATGLVRFTVSNHGYVNGDYIKVADGSLTYTCVLDGNTVQKTYPRAGYDYPSGRWLAISNVSTNTFDINVGASSYKGNHTFVSASANAIERQDGTFTINVGVSVDTSVHTFVSSTTDAVRHLPQSAHTFITASTDAVKHLPQSAHTFVRADQNALEIYPPGSAPLCASIASNIATSMNLFESILDGSIQAGATAVTYGTLHDTDNIISYPDSFIYDLDDVRMAVRGTYDDNPIIEASPYTQNASVISFLGGGGAEIDGDKVKQPNCPFPGLEIDGTASFPNQGKSMVASAFTIVSFGGIGYKVINDGYTQLVSVFCIFCSDGVLSESGGYCSITNSATNFGIYALRATGFRRDPYVFDAGYFASGTYIRATITNVSQTPTGRTIFTIENLGREPLEHYILKVDGYSNSDPDTEYFIDEITQVGAGPPFTATCIFDDGSGGAVSLIDDTTQNAVTPASLDGATVNLHRPSIVNSSAHTWEFAGSGTNYLALPENGGTKVEANEQFNENYGRVYCSGTDELGDFKVGTFAKIENRTGNITFTGTVTISEVEFLKLKGGDVVVTGFDDANTLGGANSSNSKIPTQKAVRDFITNNLGAYIQKEYSTNSVPRALVELTDSGKISLDQIPALRPFQVFTIADQTARLAIEGALAGDIAIEQDTSTSFILNNDNGSQFLAFQVDASLTFTLNDIFEGSVSGGQIQATEYRQGVLYQINITDPGSGYTQPPVITISGGSPQAGSVSAIADCTIANGQIVTITILEQNSYVGGKGYSTAPVINIAAPPGGGTQSTALGLIESRLYGNIVNNVKITDTDTFDSSDIPSSTININRAINTSSGNINNWVSLSTTTVDARDITGGPIATDLLSTNSTSANSNTFLRGDQSYALVVQSIKGPEERYFAKLAVPAQSGGVSMIFSTNQNALKGHIIKNSVTGIQEDTIIQSVITENSLTTLTFDQSKALTSTIPAGTIIEFTRAASPIRFDSTFTQGNFVEEVIIANGGSGFTNGTYYNQLMTGGTGTGFKLTLVVANNAVDEIIITTGGVGYVSDFQINTAPSDLGSGTGLDLRCKISTINRQYANVTVDIDRVVQASLDPEYGTTGVARFDKNQFFIGDAGDGSIRLKTAANSIDSGLDADLLDGKQGSFYQNAGSLTAGTIDSDRMAGTYNISISGQAQKCIRLLTATSQASSNPSPNTFAEGIIVNTKNNNSNQLLDGGTKHMVLTLRPGPDATFGGIRQLAFTDNDNMWLRGSGTGVTTFGTWAQIWTSENDGIDTGLDADKLDNREGTWYQNALNVNFGEISANRVPTFLKATGFRNEIKVKSFNGDPKYQIYVSGKVLTSLPAPNPFTPGSTVNIYNAQSQAVGLIEIDNIIVNDDLNDNRNDYTILIGRLTNGNFIGAVTIGTAAVPVIFNDFSIYDGNTIDVVTLESDGGTGNIRLGRTDNIASNPGIYFSSSSLAANYNASIVATGGTATDGSGTLNVQVATADGFGVNGNVIWNEGNVQFNSTNVLGTAVIRDNTGSFEAHKITLVADANGIEGEVVGKATANVLKEGDTMSGTLNISGASSNLSVQGTTGLTGNVTLTNDLTVATNVLYVDSANEEVGIGTTNPSDKLSVVGGVFSVNSGSGGNSLATAQGLGLTYDSATSRGYIIAKSTTTSTDITFATSNSGTLLDKIRLDATGDFFPLTATQDLGLNSTNNIYRNAYIRNVYAKDKVTIQDAGGNDGAPAYFLGASGFRNFRVGSQLLADDTFEITPSTTNGGQVWGSTPALFIKGSTNRVAINTTNFSGTDTSGGTPVVRDYQLNIEGDLNFNGQLFQNNEEFVTSRWTLNKTTNNIWRISRVGINQANPDYQLDVNGSLNVRGSTFVSGSNTDVITVNGDVQYVDTYGIFKTNRNTINENVTIPANTNAVSAGPLTINNSITITIANGSSWSVV